MKKIFGIVILVVACVGAFFIARPWFDKPLVKSDAEAAVERRIKNITETTKERLLAQAEAEKTPGQPLSEAITNVVKEEAAKALANAGSVEERRLEASIQFSGFYYINTLFRKNYCQKLGVDISSFVVAFEKENAGSYNEAHKIWLKEGIDVEAEIMEEAEKAGLEFVIDGGMKIVAQERGLSLPQTCQMFVSYANELSKSLSLEVVMPQTYDALHGK